MCTTSNCRAREESPQLAASRSGKHRVQRLGAVAVERQREAHVHELDAVGREHALAAVGGARRVRHAARHDRHLVPAGGQVDRLPVDVLGDAPELRVVIVREDADAHARGRRSVAEARRRSPPRRAGSDQSQGFRVEVDRLDAVARADEVAELRVGRAEQLGPELEQLLHHAA